MLFPTIPNYKEALLKGTDTFATFPGLEPVMDKYGDVYRIAGGFAVVFKMRDRKTGKLYALKCFHKTKNNLIEGYAQISRHLVTYETPYLVNYKFLEKEIWVSNEVTEETEFPVVLMDWVEGKTLREELKLAVADNDRGLLRHLSVQFDKMALWLLQQPFAHTDLKTENIMVTVDRRLVLIDYDGLFVPEMQGQPAREEGTEGYKHPKRNPSQFNRHTDDFSILLMSLALRLIAQEPKLYRDTQSDEHLLFTAADLTDFNKSTLHDRIWNKLPKDNGGISILFSVLKMALEAEDGHLALLPQGIRSTMATQTEKPIEYLSISLQETLSDELIEKIAFTPDGRYLLSSAYKKIIFYDTEYFTCQEILYRHLSENAIFGLSNDGELIAYEYDKNDVTFHRIADDNVSVSTYIEDDYIRFLGLSPDGKFIILEGQNRNLNIYSVKPLDLVAELKHGAASIVDACFSTDGNWIAIACADMTICLYDFSSKKLVHRFKESAGISDIKFSPDNKWLAIGCGNHVNIYDVSTKKLVQVFTGDHQGSLVFAFSPDCSLLVAGSSSSDIDVFDLRENRRVKQIDNEAKKICCICFSADGRQLAICNDERINIYEVDRSYIFIKPQPQLNMFEEAWKERNNFTAERLSEDAEARMAWWDSLEEQWKKAFRESIFYQTDGWQPNDHQINTLLNLQELYVRGSKAKQDADLGFNLTNLSGVQYLSKLTKLVCCGNDIQDLTPVKELKDLARLHCHLNEITSLEPLCDIQALEVLVCQHNYIEDLSPLSQLHNLQRLNCSDNKISDLSALDGILGNMIDVLLVRNPVSDLTGKKYTKGSPIRDDGVFLVRAGRSIGPIHLGDSRETILKKLGKKDYSASLSYSHIPNVYTYRFSKFGLSMEVSHNNHNGGVQSISVEWPGKATTAAGIRMSKDRLKDAVALYGEPELKSNNFGTECTAWIGNIGFATVTRREKYKISYYNDPLNCTICKIVIRNQDRS